MGLTETELRNLERRGSPPDAWGTTDEELAPEEWQRLEERRGEVRRERERAREERGQPDPWDDPYMMEEW